LRWLRLVRSDIFCGGDPPPLALAFASSALSLETALLNLWRAGFLAWIGMPRRTANHIWAWRMVERVSSDTVRYRLLQSW
jgi:hypothetical protein